MTAKLSATHSIQFLNEEMTFNQYEERCEMTVLMKLQTGSMVRVPLLKSKASLLDEATITKIATLFDKTIAQNLLSNSHWGRAALLRAVFSFCDLIDGPRYTASIANILPHVEKPFLPK